MNRNENIDGLKAFTVLYIILHHFNLYRYYRPLYFITGQGQFAVILLFVLSGYVIGLNYSVGQAVGLGFLRKRFLRIYPVFISSLIVNYSLVSWNNGYWVEFPIETFLGNVINLQDLSRYEGVMFGPFMGNTPLWYLSYLWWFYILFFVIRLTPISNKFIAVFIVSALSAIIFYFWPNTILHILSYWVIWWIGFELASKAIKLKQNKKVVFLPLFVLLGIYGLGILNTKDWTAIWAYPILEIRHFIFAILIVSLILFRQEMNINLHFFKRFASLSKISLGLFLLHFPILISANPFHTGVWVLDIGMASILLVSLAYLLDYRLYTMLKK